MYIAFFAVSIISYAQLGILTPTPQNTLHVNGSLQVVKDLNVGGTASTKGNSGNKGEVLMSNGVGNAPEWRSIESENFLKVVYVGNKTTISPTSGSYTGTHTMTNALESYSKTYVYNISNKEDNAYLTYNSSTGLFTVIKQGYYNIVTNINYDLSLNADGYTAGTAKSYIQKVSPSSAILAATSTGHGERTSLVTHNLSSINFFNTGETFRIRGIHTQDFRLSAGNIYITYLTP